MVRINKVYTRQGDTGQTGLAGGQRLAKDAPRIEAYGTVDELNAQIGIVLEQLRPEPQSLLRNYLLRIQNELFDLGSQLAVLPQDRRENTPVVTNNDVTRLENEIDSMNENLPPLQSFILPGGGAVSAQLHVARTVCRRAERHLVSLAAIETLDGTELTYLNRLSDWLFVASRVAASDARIKETLWQPGQRES